MNIVDKYKPKKIKPNKWNEKSQNFQRCHQCSFIDEGKIIKHDLGVNKI